MIVNIDDFYNNNNYKQYVPLQAFQKELQLVSKTFLKDVKIKNVLSVTFSIDDYGESPIYIEYLDENEQKHLVKLKPAIHEELDSVLKQYAKITYVDSEITKAIQTSKDYTDVTKEALTILINGSKEEAIEVSKAYTDVEINKLNTDLKQYIDEHDNSVVNTLTTLIDTSVTNATNVSKEYTDDEINKVKQEMSSGNVTVLQQANDYTDDLRDELTPQIEANKNRLKIKNATDPETDVEPTGHVTFEVNDGIKAIEVKQNDSEEMPSERVDFSDFALKGDIPENVVTNDYLNTQLENYETKTEASVDHKKLSEVPNNHHQPYISWFPDIDSDYIRMVHDENETKFHINNSQTKEETVGYLSSRNPANFATTSELEPLTSKLSNIWGSHKAAFIYWIPNIDVNTMKLENAENDVKVTLNDSDTVYWSKNPTETMTGDPVTQPVEISSINWYMTNGFISTTSFSLSFGQPTITNWSMRLIADIYGVSGWCYKFVTGYFVVSVPNLYVKPYMYKIDATSLYDELKLEFKNSIESWANRSIQIIPAQIKFGFASIEKESNWVSCFAKIENKQLTLDNFDEHKMKTICDYVENNTLEGTEGTITIRLNGGY